MMETPEGAEASAFIRLQRAIDAGLTTALAIALVMGISEDEASSLLAGKVDVSPQQRADFEALLADYTRAIKTANARAMKRRLLQPNVAPSR